MNLPQPCRPHVLALIAALIVAAALPTAACARKESPPDVTGAGTAPPKGTVVFDMGHGEIFGATETGDLGQSRAIERIRAAGFDVTVNSDPITAEDLEGASGLMIAGPMRPLADAEYDAITAFVERGGTVLLTIHVPFPVLKVPAHWGLPVGTEILMSKRSVAQDGSPSIFAADSVSPNRVTEGVKSVVVVSGWPVTAASPTGTIAVATGADTWLSSAGDQSPEPPADASFTSYGVIGVASVGKGLVIVSGDDAVFANIALDAGDNGRLLDNIIGLMSDMVEA